MDKTESSKETGTGSHLQIFFYRVPKKNHDAIELNLKRFMPWFKENGIRLEYYQLGKSDAMEGMDDISKTLSATEDEEIWMEQQYYRDRKHCEETFAKMMQDKNLEQLGKEFISLITPGKNFVTGGFSPLRA